MSNEPDNVEGTSGGIAAEARVQFNPTREEAEIVTHASHSIET
jgi:hypothetical protein